MHDWLTPGARSRVTLAGEAAKEAGSRVILTAWFTSVSCGVAYWSQSVVKSSLDLLRV